jgi:hypothetical protein
MVRSSLSIVVLLGISVAPLSAFAGKQCPPELAAEDPMVPNSVEQADINSGALSFDDILDHGELLFGTKFNICDGRGRPETTGGGDHRLLPTISEEGDFLDQGQVAKLRTSAPDSDACGGCHA